MTRDTRRLLTGAIIALVPLTLALTATVDAWPPAAWLIVGVALAPLAERALTWYLLAAMLGPHRARRRHLRRLRDGDGWEIS